MTKMRASRMQSSGLAAASRKSERSHRNRNPATRAPASSDLFPIMALSTGWASTTAVTTQHLRDFVEGGALPDGLLAEAKRLADQYQFFHWYLAFPEVFQHGGLPRLISKPP